MAATALRVLPGELLGSATSRILVRHSGELPRSVEAPGRIRLTWLPEVSPTRERRVVAESPPPEAEEAARRERAREEARREEEDRRRAEAEREAREREEDGRRAQAEREAREREEDERRAAAEREAREREDERRRAAERDEARRRAEALAEAEREPEPERRRVVVDRPSEPVRPPASLPPDYAALSSPARLVVTIPTVVKDGPGRRYRTLKRLAAGDRATVQGRAGDWYLLGDGSSWVFATFLEAADSASSSAPSYLGVVQDVTVPVHEGPGGQHAVVAELYRGQQVVIDELNGEWAHVRNGGWVRRSALGPLEPGREGR